MTTQLKNLAGLFRTTKHHHKLKVWVCCAHTDVEQPDWDRFRRKALKDPTKPTYCSESQRKSFTYVISGCCISAALYSTKTELMRYIRYMAASAEVLAMAKIEINLSDIPEGKNATFKWRGKPLFIKHRTSDEIERERAVPMSDLRDPQPDEDRCSKPEWLVVIGVCTHLGCVPVANTGDYPGGYYCPCHGSHYDAAGRIRKGPAPTNLEIPQHAYIGDNTLIVG